MNRFTAMAAAVLVSLPFTAAAESAPSGVQAAETSSAEVVTIRLKDGSSLRARIVAEDADQLKIVTASGLAMDVPRGTVERIDHGSETGPRPSDSNCTRLLFSPTGRPLRKGEGYFSDHYVIFPGVAYGVTDNISLGGGLSVVPGLGLGDQLYYGTVRVGKQFSDRFAISGGVLAARGGEGETDTLGLGFAMATLGRPDKSLTLGAGVARTVQEEYYYTPGTRTSPGVGGYRNKSLYTPVIMVGGTVRLSPHMAFVSENWLILKDDFKLSEQPFALGLRFLGDKLTADVGLVLVGEVIEEGLPVPWLSVTYHFGKKK
jgi:hypothetical protein